MFAHVRTRLGCCLWRSQGGNNDDRQKTLEIIVGREDIVDALDGGVEDDNSIQNASVVMLDPNSQDQETMAQQCSFLNTCSRELPDGSMHLQLVGMRNDAVSLGDMARLLNSIEKNKLKTLKLTNVRCHGTNGYVNGILQKALARQSLIECFECHGCCLWLPRQDPFPATVASALFSQYMMEFPSLKKI